MARDLSASPWRSAAIAPLFTPIALSALAAMEGFDKGIGGLDAFIRTVLTVWFVASAYMWILAVPTMLFTRRWVTWSWPRLLVLGALLGVLPWAIVPVSELSGRPDLSFAQWVSEFFHSLLFMDDYIVVKFGAFPGAFVAGVFCLLQLHMRRAPSNNRLQRTGEG
jgi:hypothetical protein